MKNLSTKKKTKQEREAETNKGNQARKTSKLGNKSKVDKNTLSPKLKGNSNNNMFTEKINSKNNQPDEASNKIINNENNPKPVKSKSPAPRKEDSSNICDNDNAFLTQSQVKNIAIITEVNNENSKNDKNQMIIIQENNNLVKESSNEFASELKSLSKKENQISQRNSKSKEKEKEENEFLNEGFNKDKITDLKQTNNNNINPNSTTNTNTNNNNSNNNTNNINNTNNNIKNNLPIASNNNYPPESTTENIVIKDILPSVGKNNTKNTEKKLSNDAEIQQTVENPSNPNQSNTNNNSTLLNPQQLTQLTNTLIDEQKNEVCASSKHEETQNNLIVKVNPQHLKNQSENEPLGEKQTKNSTRSNYSDYNSLILKMLKTNSETRLKEQQQQSKIQESSKNNYSGVNSNGGVITQKNLKELVNSITIDITNELEANSKLSNLQQKSEGKSITLETEKDKDKKKSNNNNKEKEKASQETSKEKRSKLLFNKIITHRKTASNLLDDEEELQKTIASQKAASKNTAYGGNNNNTCNNSNKSNSKAPKLESVTTSNFNSNNNNQTIGNHKPDSGFNLINLQQKPNQGLINQLLPGKNIQNNNTTMDKKIQSDLKPSNSNNENLSIPKAKGKQAVLGKEENIVEIPVKKNILIQLLNKCNEDSGKPNKETNKSKENEKSNKANNKPSIKTTPKNHNIKTNKDNSLNFNNNNNNNNPETISLTEHQPITPSLGRDLKRKVIKINLEESTNQLVNIEAKTEFSSSNNNNNYNSNTNTTSTNINTNNLIRNEIPNKAKNDLLVLIGSNSEVTPKRLKADLQQSLETKNCGKYLSNCTSNIINALPSEQPTNSILNKLSNLQQKQQTNNKTKTKGSGRNLVKNATQVNSTNGSNTLLISKKNSIAKGKGRNKSNLKMRDSKSMNKEIMTLNKIESNFEIDLDINLNSNDNNKCTNNNEENYEVVNTNENNIEGNLNDISEISNVLPAFNTNNEQNNTNNNNYCSSNNNNNNSNFNSHHHASKVNAVNNNSKSRKNKKNAFVPIVKTNLYEAEENGVLNASFITSNNDSLMLIKELDNNNSGGGAVNYGSSTLSEFNSLREARRNTAKYINASTKAQGKSMTNNNNKSKTNNDYLSSNQNIVKREYKGKKSHSTKQNTRYASNTRGESKTYKGENGFLDDDDDDNDNDDNEGTVHIKKRKNKSQCKSNHNNKNLMEMKTKSSFATAANNQRTKYNNQSKSKEKHFTSVKKTASSNVLSHIYDSNKIDSNANSIYAGVAGNVGAKSKSKKKFTKKNTLTTICNANDIREFNKKVFNEFKMDYQNEIADNLNKLQNRLKTLNNLNKMKDICAGSLKSKNSKRGTFRGAGNLSQNLDVNTPDVREELKALKSNLVSKLQRISKAICTVNSQANSQSKSFRLVPRKRSFDVSGKKKTTAGDDHELSNCSISEISTSKMKVKSKAVSNSLHKGNEKINTSTVMKPNNTNNSTNNNNEGNNNLNDNILPDEYIDKNSLVHLTKTSLNNMNMINTIKALTESVERAKENNKENSTAEAADETGVANVIANCDFPDNLNSHCISSIVLSTVLNNNNNNQKVKSSLNKVSCASSKNLIASQQITKSKSNIPKASIISGNNNKTTQSQPYISNKLTNRNKQVTGSKIKNTTISKNTGGGKVHSNKIQMYSNSKQLKTKYVQKFELDLDLECNQSTNNIINNNNNNNNALPNGINNPSNNTSNLQSNVSNDSFAKHGCSKIININNIINIFSNEHTEELINSFKGIRNLENCDFNDMDFNKDKKSYTTFDIFDDNDCGSNTKVLQGQSNKLLDEEYGTVSSNIGCSQVSDKLKNARKIRSKVKNYNTCINSNSLDQILDEGKRSYKDNKEKSKQKTSFELREEINYIQKQQKESSKQEDYSKQINQNSNSNNKKGVLGQDDQFVVDSVDRKNNTNSDNTRFLADILIAERKNEGNNDIRIEETINNTEIRGEFSKETKTGTNDNNAIGASKGKAEIIESTSQIRQLTACNNKGDNSDNFKDYTIKETVLNSILKKSNSQINSSTSENIYNKYTERKIDKAIVEKHLIDLRKRDGKSNSPGKLINKIRRKIKEQYLLEAFEPVHNQEENKYN